MDLPIAEALVHIQGQLQALTGRMACPLSAALGRVLAADVVSPIDVPAHDNSAMDGYAFRAADGPVPRRSVVAATVLAGRPLPLQLAPGDAVRIMTGAVMPDGLDTVVPLELCQVDPTSATGLQLSWPEGSIAPGANRRLRGEDLAAGQVALPAGRRLQPPDLALLASLGLAEVSVRPRLRVAVFSTGDELRAAGEPLAPGCIYDSNRQGLLASLAGLGMDTLDLGLVPDDPAALARTLDAAIAGADVVLSSGGISAGDADHTRRLLAERGEMAFWKLAMRPGRPFAFGRLQAADGRPVWLFGLPGNPVAALVAFQVLVRDALLQLAGATPTPRPALPVRLRQALKKRAGRSEFLRGWVQPEADGHWSVGLAGGQGSGQLHSLAQANALILLSPEQTQLAAGETVPVWLFDGLH